MTPTRAGRLRRRAILQAPAAEAFDTFGQPVQAWTTVGTYWAGIRPLQGREAVAARQVKAEATHAVTMRYLGSAVALNPAMRLLFGSRVFGITEVVNVEESGRRYELVVQEIEQRGQV